MIFETEHIKLYHGDCFDILRDMPDNSVDAVITDPPLLCTIYLQKKKIDNSK